MDIKEKGFEQYTAAELEHHRCNNLPMWSATIAMRSKVYKDRVVLHDVEAPSKELVEMKVRSFLKQNNSSYVVRCVELVYEVPLWAFKEGYAHYFN